MAAREYLINGRWRSVTELMALWDCSRDAARYRADRMGRYRYKAGKA